MTLGSWRSLFTRKVVIAEWELNILVIGLLSIGILVGSLFTLSRFFPKIFAAGDVNYVWDFSVPGDYVVSDAEQIEVTGSGVSLKVRDYSSDANTALLFHLDETSGSTVEDSSGNNNDGSLVGGSWTTGNLNNGLSLDGITEFINVFDAPSLSLTQSNTLEAWIKFDSSFGSGTHAQRQGIISKGDYQLYLDNETGRVTYELANSAATTWTQVAGNDINDSWDLDGQLGINAQTQVGSSIYVGLGTGTGDAEVWRWDGTNWEKVGGDAINSSWASFTFEQVLSLANDGTDVYAGLGTTAGDGEVWKYTVSTNTWVKIGGDAINSSWQVNTFEGVYSLYYQNSILYAGLGVSANDAEVWSWNGTSWTKIGGDSLNSGWTTNFEQVASLYGDGTNMYAGLGTSAGDAEVWRWNGSAWTRIGGDGVNFSWANSTFETVLSMTYAGGFLYAGIGVSADDAEVWRWNGSAWTQIGGDSLNSGWTTGYEGVYSLTHDGTDIFAGLGLTGGDHEVWQWSTGSSTWSKIGGDGQNGSFTGTTHTIVNTLLFYDNSLYAGIISNNAGRAAEVWEYTSGAWTQIAGNYVNNSWGYRGLQSVEVMQVVDDYLYAGTGFSNTGNALVWQFDGASWTLVGGQEINSSWTKDAYELVTSMASYEGELYVGLGSTANDAEVWRWNGSVWTQLGGDSLNSGWTTNYEEVNSMAVVDGYLYAGLGNTAGDAEVWQWDGASWIQIGGTASGNWGTAAYDRVVAMAVFRGNVIAGLGSSGGEAELWEYSGSSTNWTKIGGDSVDSSWASPTFEQVESLITYNGTLVAGLGTGAGDAEVWQFDGSSWTLIGGNEINSSWETGSYERTRTLVVYNGDLYAGLGVSTGDAEVWRYHDNTWSQIGGDSLNSGWSNAMEEVESFSPYKGKLYVGTGNTQNIDATIWTYGNNSYLQSATDSFDTNWHHIAATYDGNTMKIFIDGTEDSSVSSVVSIPDSSNDVFVGTTHGGREYGKPQGYFQGTLDEVRISNVARTSFITTPYATTAQTVRPATAVFTEDINNWEDFNETNSAGLGTITYRISSNSGATWNYWNGSSWVASSSTSQANDATTMTDQIDTFTVGSEGIMWQAILLGDGTEAVTLDQLEITATSDTTDPTPPDTLTALSQSGGTAITTDTWYPYTSPYFSWSGATDTGGSGVDGYYVYFGTDDTADPQTAGSFQSGSTFIASGLTSGQTYYLRIRSRDVAQNVSSIWDPFIYKFDNTAPNNPSGLSVSPSGYSGTNEFTFFWSTVGTDDGSGVAGYQYKTAATSGAFSDWSSTITTTSVTLTDVAYQENENIFLLRTVDNAGNASSSTVQVSFYFAGEAPTAPQDLEVTPSTSTTNSFSFTWNPPATFSGTQNELRYCYTINTLPSSSTCTFTAPGVTALPADSYANQPGENTLYLAARDNVGNISYGAYASVTFTANTAAPGIPLNVEIADVSVKTTESWKLALSWEPPSGDEDVVSSYQVYHSTDDESYELASSTNGIAYIGTGLTQVTHYYKVRACDNANNCGAFTEPVSMLPDGRFTEPAELVDGPDVSNISTRKATITWLTDRDSDSKIAYGTSSNDYFEGEPSNSTPTTNHSIVLEGLEPGKRYFYVAKWTDEDGNTGVSEEKTFETTPAPSIQSVSIPSITLSTALIQFTSTNAAKVEIEYGIGASLGSSKSVETSLVTSTYTALLENLSDGTTYNFRINPVDGDGFEYEGTVFEFTTLPRPRISDVRVQEVRGTAQPTVLVTWNTNVETNSLVSFYPTSNQGLQKDQIDVVRTQGEHRMVISNLLNQTPYTFIIKGTDINGNEAVSDPQFITTALDTRPPKITNLQVSSNIVTSSASGEVSAQIVISWDTDELATSQVEFAEGTGTTYSQKTQEDTNLANNHLVIISGLSPSKVYHLRAISKDTANNIGTSVDTVTITPKATTSALDLVISNLQQIFGFLRNL